MSGLKIVTQYKVSENWNLFETFLGNEIELGHFADFTNARNVKVKKVNLFRVRALFCSLTVNSLSFVNLATDEGEIVMFCQQHFAMSLHSWASSFGIVRILTVFESFSEFGWTCVPMVENWWKNT